jgi:hypothetical protein
MMRGDYRETRIRKPKSGPSAAADGPYKSKNSPRSQAEACATWGGDIG